MQLVPPAFDRRTLDAFVALAGARAWAARMRDIGVRISAGPRAGQVIRQHHWLELAIERLRGTLVCPPSTAEIQVARLARRVVLLADQLSAPGRRRLRKHFAAALAGEGTLAWLFHLVGTAELQRARGFGVHHCGLEEGTPYDLLLNRGAAEAEVVCDVMPAEEGRLVRRGAWFQLADRIDPDLQIWLQAHPGRYLLKVTLPLGLSVDGNALAGLHERIRRLLATPHRHDQDAAAVLRLDPLLLAGAQSEDIGLMSRLRQEFGPEAHLSITAAGGGVFAMAARGGGEDAIAAAMRRRLSAIAPTRLSGTRPGILAMLVDGADRDEWRGLCERLELEREARQFLVHKDARSVVAVTCGSRLELLGSTGPKAAEGGELRFRNPAHPAAKMPALAPAVLSSV